VRGLGRTEAPWDCPLFSAEGWNPCSSDDGAEPWCGVWGALPRAGAIRWLTVAGGDVKSASGSANLESTISRGEGSRYRGIEGSSG